jgi:hypothetical protein
MTQPPANVPLRSMIASLIILISGAVIVIAKAPQAQGIRSYVAANGPPALQSAINAVHRAHTAQIIVELVQDIRKHPR